MNRSLHFLFILLIPLSGFASIAFGPVPQYHAIGCISISDDGNLIAWNSYNAICISGTEKPNEYKKYSLSNMCKHGVHSLQLSGDGRTIAFDCDSNIFISKVYSNNISKFVKLDLSTYGEVRRLKINENGKKLLIHICGNIESKKCSPEWENIVLFSKRPFMWTPSSLIRKTTECEFIFDYNFISDNQVLYQFRDTKHVLRIVKTDIDKNDNWCCDKYIDNHNFNLVAHNKEGDLFILSEKRVMNNGDSIISLYESYLIDDSTLSQPLPIFEDHKDPIVWGTTLSPDSKSLIWTHYTRGQDGNAIIKQDVRIMNKISGKWSKPVVLFELPIEIDIRQIVMSNRNILLNTVKDRNQIMKANKPLGCTLFYYSSLAKNGKLIEINNR